MKESQRDERMQQRLRAVLKHDEHRACYWSVNVVKIMMTGLERLMQSICRRVHACVNVCVWMRVSLYLAYTRCYTRVTVCASFHAAFTTLTRRVVLVTNSAPGRQIKSPLIKNNMIMIIINTNSTW